MRIALDPGKTTGVAWRTADGELRSLEIPGDDINVILDGFHRAHFLTEVVYEIFRSRPGPAVNLSAPHTIGRIMAWCDEAGVRMVGQEVAAMKIRVTGDRLREVGGWKRGSTHERDARGHLLYREEKVTGVDYWPRKKSKKSSK